MKNIAQVGCGYWGRNLVRNFSELGVLAAIVDHDITTSLGMSKQYGVPVRSLDEVLNDKNITGISFATPASTHADLAVEAFKYGKHVFVEKPLALTIEDCDRMIAAAKTYDCRLMVGHLLQYHPTFNELVAQLQKGRIGDLQYIYSRRMSLGKFRTEEDVMWSFAPHDISMVLRLVGKEPEKIAAHSAAYITPGTADWCTIHMAFPNGIHSHIEISWLHPFKEQRLVAIGTQGMLVFEDSEPNWSRKLACYPHRIDYSLQTPVPQKQEVEYIEVPREEPLKLECLQFSDCVTSRTASPHTNGQEGRAVLRVLSIADAFMQNSLEENGFGNSQKYLCP
ncbi:MAG: Gfo/Idh/MocA family oxidoreductase [Bacteroidetes bacterium]|nr:Gfo/Idh/MocA family oxidoreductase [Bacteroidota bacterium]